MTQHPEAALARELEMCYPTSRSSPTTTSGVVGEIEPVTHEEVIRVFQENIGQLRELLFRVIAGLPEDRDLRVRHRARQRPIRGVRGATVPRAAARGSDHAPRAGRDGRRTLRSAGCARVSLHP